MATKNENEYHPAPNWLTKEYLEKIFSVYKKSNNLKITSLEIVPATNKGDNYASVMTRIKLGFNCQCSGTGTGPNNDNRIHNYIVKTSFEENAFANEIFKEYQTFESEMNMYEYVVPKLNEILKRINKDEYIFPDVIYVDRQHTAIIMEDLSEKSYITADRIERLNLDQAKFALIKMVKMHAASIVLNSELKTNYLKSFDHGIFNRYTRKFQTFFHPFIEECGDVAINIGGEYKTYGEKLKKLIPNFMDKCESTLDVFENHLNVLNHGDFWTNNIMFKYNSNKQIENVILLDFQFSKWTSPAWDLHYFFNTAIKEEQRHKGQHELIKFYHENLIDILKKLNYNGNIPDLHQFNLQMAEKEFIAMAVTLTSYILLINEETEDADFDALIKNDERSKKFRRVACNNPQVTKTIKNMLPIYDRHGLLDN